MERKDTFAKYAIFKLGSHQYQGIEGKTLAIQKIDGEVGQTVEFNEVLLRKLSEDAVEIGQPLVAGSFIKAAIVKHFRGPKLTVFKFKRRKKYRVKRGHRQDLTIVRIETV
jgi:large subunit ribosomal protein L21